MNYSSRRRSTEIGSIKRNRMLDEEPDAGWRMQVSGCNIFRINGRFVETLWDLVSINPARFLLNRGQVFISLLVRDARSKNLRVGASALASTFCVCVLPWRCLPRFDSLWFSLILFDSLWTFHLLIYYLMSEEGRERKMRFYEMHKDFPELQFSGGNFLVAFWKPS